MKQKCLEFNRNGRIVLVISVLGEEPTFWVYNDRLMQELCSDNIYVTHY